MKYMMIPRMNMFHEDIVNGSAYFAELVEIVKKGYQEFLANPDSNKSENYEKTRFEYEALIEQLQGFFPLPKFYKVKLVL